MYGEVDHSLFFDAEDGRWWGGETQIRRSIFMGDFVVALSAGGDRHEPQHPQPVRFGRRTANGWKIQHLGRGREEKAKADGSEGKDPTAKPRATMKSTPDDVTGRTTTHRMEKTDRPTTTVRHRIRPSAMEASKHGHDGVHFILGQIARKADVAQSGQHRITLKVHGFDVFVMVHAGEPSGLVRTT